MLETDLGRHARRFLARIPGKHFVQIEHKIIELAQNPFPSDCKKLHGFPHYRVDTGEYRIVYKVVGTILDIPLIGKRNDDDVYRRLKRLER